MSDNPYQPPSADSQIVGIKSGEPRDLKSVAKFQKGLLFSILLQLIAVISSFSYSISQFIPPNNFDSIVILLVLVGGMSGTFFVFSLAIKVYSPLAGVLLGMLTLIPCIGLIILAAVNGKATSILKQNGIKVGFLGAKLSQIQAD